MTTKTGPLSPDEVPQILLTRPRLARRSRLLKISRKEDILGVIVSYLDSKDVLRLSRVNKKMRFLMSLCLENPAFEMAVKYFRCTPEKFIEKFTDITLGMKLNHLYISIVRPLARNHIARSPICVKFALTDETTKNQLPTTVINATLVEQNRESTEGTPNQLPEKTASTFSYNTSAKIGHLAINNGVAAKRISKHFPDTIPNEALADQLGEIAEAAMMQLADTLRAVPATQELLSTIPLPPNDNQG